MTATEARTASTAFRVTPRPMTQSCYSGSARGAPAPRVSSTKRRGVAAKPVAPLSRFRGKTGEYIGVTLRSRRWPPRI